MNAPSIIANRLKVCTELSFTKNLIPLTDLPPSPIVTWDKYLRVRRHLEIWNKSCSIVNRLPKHYQDHFWKNLLYDRQPVHYMPPQYRFYWDEKRLVEIEAEVSLSIQF